MLANSETKSSNDAKYGLIKSDLSSWVNKKYLGGYKQKQNGMEFFHAIAQTITPQELQIQVSFLFMRIAKSAFIDLLKQFTLLIRKHKQLEIAALKWYYISQSDKKRMLCHQ